MNSLWTLIKFEVKIIFRNYKTLLSSLVFPMGILLLYYVINKDQQDPYGPGETFIQGLIPIIFCFNIAAFSLYQFTTSVIQYRELGILRRYRVTPLKSWKVIVSQIIAGLVMLYFSSIVPLVVSLLAFGAKVHGNIFAIFGAFTLGAITFFGLAIVLSLLVKDTRTVSSVASGLFMPMLFLSGVTIPLKVMPSFLQIISKILPLTYVVKVIQEAWYPLPFTSSILANLLILTGFTAVFMYLGVKNFKWE